MRFKVYGILFYCSLIVSSLVTLDPQILHEVASFLPVTSASFSFFVCFTVNFCLVNFLQQKSGADKRQSATRLPLSNVIIFHIELVTSLQSSTCVKYTCIEEKNMFRPVFEVTCSVVGSLVKKKTVFVSKMILFYLKYSF